MKLHKDTNGFIPLIVGMIIVLIVVIIFAYSRVLAAR